MVNGTTLMDITIKWLNSHRKQVKERNDNAPRKQADEQQQQQQQKQQQQQHSLIDLHKVTLYSFSIRKSTILKD